MEDIRDVLLPDIGETDGVRVVEVLVRNGDRVAVDDSLLVLESDKASMEVPSPVAGTVVEIKVEVGGGVTEGMVLARVRADESAQTDTTEAKTEDGRVAGAPAAPPPVTEAPAPAPPAPPAAAEAPSPASGLPPIDEKSFARAYASPAVRRFARELGVDLGRVKGSGRKSRILRDDVREFVKAVMSQPATAAPAAGVVGGFEWPRVPDIDFSKFGPIERRTLHRIRRLSAANLHRAWLHAPHVTQHEEADITEMEAFRKSQSEEASRRGFKLTPVAFLIKAVLGALREYPELNASLDPNGEDLILKKYFHIGVAVDTPNGLMVPVLRDADQKGLFDLAKELGELAARARDGKSHPKDLSGASFTITSLGGIGGTFFTPVINVPEVAILGVSRAVTKPVWNGGEFVPRLMLPLSLSYDHRVIDGAMAARFIVHLSGYLADLRSLLL